MITTRPSRRSIRTSLVLCAFVAAAFLLGCSSSDPAPANPYFAGTWQGNINVTSGPSEGASFAVTVTVWQDGDEVNGTFTNGAGIDGSLHGTVGGNKLTFQMTQVVVDIFEIIQIDKNESCVRFLPF